MTHPKKDHAKDEPVEKDHTKDTHSHAAGGLHIVRAGNHVVNLAQFVSAELPADGDANRTLRIMLSTGETFTLTGEDADAFLLALGAHCDVAPCKKEKDAKEPPV